MSQCVPFCGETILQIHKETEMNFVKYDECLFLFAAAPDKKSGNLCI